MARRGASSNVAAIGGKNAKSNLLDARLSVMEIREAVIFTIRGQ